jgi:hypothetical protein
MKWKRENKYGIADVGAGCPRCGRDADQVNLCVTTPVQDTKGCGRYCCNKCIMPVANGQLCPECRGRPSPYDRELDPETSTG